MDGGAVPDHYRHGFTCNQIDGGNERYKQCRHYCQGNRHAMEVGL